MISFVNLSNNFLSLAFSLTQTRIQTFNNSNPIMACKDCRSSAGGAVGATNNYGNASLLMNDVWKLYSPEVRLGPANPVSDFFCKKRKEMGLGRGQSCGKTSGGCRQGGCNPQRNCLDQFKCYWYKSGNVDLAKAYEDQPWFQNPVVQGEWQTFLDQLITPCNAGCPPEQDCCPHEDDYEFTCSKARALFGPKDPNCVWDLPEQNPSDTTQYGINRDWRRYNEDQRVASSDVTCSQNSIPHCRFGDPPRNPGEWPPYMGQKYGPRYMMWAHPTTRGFPRGRNFNYQSNPKC